MHSRSRSGVALGDLELRRVGRRQNQNCTLGLVKKVKECV